MSIIRYLIVITLVPLILITRFVQFAHSVVLMTRPNPWLMTGSWPTYPFVLAIFTLIVLAIELITFVQEEIAPRSWKFSQKMILQYSTILEEAVGWEEMTFISWQISTIGQMSANFFRQSSRVTRLVNNEALSFPKWNDCPGQYRLNYLTRHKSKCYHARDKPRGESSFRATIKR